MVQVNRKFAVWRRKRIKMELLAEALPLTRGVKKLLSLVFFGGFLVPLGVNAQAWKPGSDWLNVGLIYDRVPLTLREGERTEVLGPLFSWEESGNGSLFTFSPLFSLYRDSSVQQTEAELGYPILSLDKFGKEYRFQILQVIAFSGGER